MKLWIIALIVALLLAPNAFAGDDQRPASGDDAREAAPDELDTREGIIAVLSLFHEVPTREQLERVTEDARAHVFEIARDEEAFLFHRQRAIRALVHWPDQEVFDYLVELIDDEEDLEGLTHHILPVLADGFGEKALDELEPFLFEAEDPHVRISAAGAISNIPGERGVKMLQEALHAEQNPVVQSRLERFTAQVR